MKTVSISLDDEPLPEDVRATVHTMEGEHARPEDVGKRWISLDVGGAVSITFPEFDERCARRALAIAAALTRAAIEILEPRPPKPLEAALTRAKTFIEYARHELQPGKATIGDQFPRQEDADAVLSQIVDVLGKAPTPAPPAISDDDIPF